jgi:hypothetical protein
MFAYFYKQIKATQIIDDKKIIADIAHVGGWIYIDFTYEGTEGCLIYQKGFQFKAEFIKNCYTEQVNDNVIFLIHNDTTLEDLERTGNEKGLLINLQNGYTITVPNALIQSRQFKLSSKTMGKPLTEYGRLAQDLLTDVEHSNNITVDDDRVIRLVELALNYNYAVTRHVIDFLEIISYDDIDPIISAAWGLKDDIKKKE